MASRPRLTPFRARSPSRWKHGCSISQRRTSPAIVRWPAATSPMAWATSHRPKARSACCATPTESEPMRKLAQSDLYTLEAYARERPAMRERVIAHKQVRAVHLGAHLTLLFEDRLTIHYQVQEMLRIERIFEAQGIQDELDTYNPLIPDGTNLKATLLIEYADADERARKLMELHGIERGISIAVGELPPVVAIADEDLERSTDEKTSAVHFLRFELSSAQVAAIKSGAQLALAVDHPAYRERVALSTATRAALAGDLD